MEQCGYIRKIHANSKPSSEASVGDCDCDHVAVAVVVGVVVVVAVEDDVDGGCGGCGGGGGRGGCLYCYCGDDVFDADQHDVLSHAHASYGFCDAVFHRAGVLKETVMQMVVTMIMAMSL